MSTIKANDIQNASGGIPTVKGQKLIPTAWVNFNGTGTVAIRDSENVSSITDAGAGDYRVNFAVVMANANYSTIASGRWDDGRAGTYFGYATINYTGIATSDNNGSMIDSDTVTAIVMGGQA